MVIQQIDAWLCEVALNPPVDLGRVLIKQRSYLVVRMRCSDGLVSECVTQARGSPLDVIAVDLLAPLLLGRNYMDLQAIRRDVAQAMVVRERNGAIGRTWSALEICLYDLKAQAAGWPLWRLLGGMPRTLPVQIVEGYGIAGESDEAFVDRLLQRIDDGFTRIKIEAGHYYASPQTLISRLELLACRASGNPKLILDFAWTWRNARDGQALLGSLAHFDIDWIEDPYPSTNCRSYEELRRVASIAVGCGDEASNEADLYTLIGARAVDVLRIDATAIGGISTAWALGDEASRQGLRVSYHEHPEVHEHLAFGLGVVDHIEMFPTDRQFDQAHQLTVTNSFERVSNGCLSPTDSAGTGVRVDAKAVERSARRHSSANL